jgi:glycosyltransferase involved in cell wall biosynthesis
MKMTLKPVEPAHTANDSMTPVRKVLYTAAHSGFNLGKVPLGGGAAVCERLLEEWTRRRPFEFEVLGPSILGESAPKEKDLVLYSELQYARFCRVFEKKLTETIWQHDPRETVVLSNDVSEGPDFQALAAKGYSIYTIYHVDVVDYFTTIYLRSWVKPEQTTALYRAIRRWGILRIVPDVLKLIWDKQEASVRCSKGLIVPSQRMKEVLLHCYPTAASARIHVVPWGVPEDPVSSTEVQREKEAIQKMFHVPPRSWKLLTLSRISPEKGQDRLLEALALWERQADFPTEGVCLFIAGEAAYMMGIRFEKELKKLAAKLKRSQICFVGYASGARKKALFELADLYVFPSRHESYGLTLLEALREGKPVLATPSYGAQEVFQSGFGVLTAAGPESSVPGHLMAALKRLVSDRSNLQKMGREAAIWAQNQDFSKTAATLAELIASQ